MTKLDWNASEGQLQFETTVLRGVLRADGRHHSISELVYKPTDTRVDSGMMLAPYRLLARSAWMGEARAMPHRVNPTEDGIEIIWDASLNHQVTLGMRITFPDPHLIDTTIDVTGHAFYPDYEVFLSAYFRQGFRSGAYVRPAMGESPTTAIQLQPEGNPLFREMYLAFPRDEQAAHIITDGRWQRGRHHTRFLPARYYGLPLGFYGQTGGALDVLFMGTPEDVFAVNMAYLAADPEDQVGQHNSLYLSLFGRDLHPGERWRTRVRLAFGEYGRDQNAHQQEYQRFIEVPSHEAGIEIG